MKPKFRIVWLVLVLALLLPCSAALANDESDASDSIRVDVVVDMTDAGRKIPHPTPDKPAYYLPLSVGYKTFGFTRRFQRPPPNEWDIQHALAKALYQQGYQLMTKEGHPSLVLVFWWGYMAPEDVDMNNPTAPIQRGGSLQAPPGFYWGGGSADSPYKAPIAGAYDNFVGASGGGNSSSSTGLMPAWTMGSDIINDQMMLTMIAGETNIDRMNFNDPRIDAIATMAESPRYYVLISALDFNAWLHHKVVLLWRAHISTELWGHYFDQVAGALITTAAPLFGRETRVPNFVGAQLVPLGRVIVGTPEVKDFQVAPASAKKP